MITGELVYFLIGEVALALHQQSAQHHPSFLPLVDATLCRQFVQRGAAVCDILWPWLVVARHIVLYCKACLWSTRRLHISSNCCADGWYLGTSGANKNGKRPLTRNTVIATRCAAIATRCAASATRGTVIAAHKARLQQTATASRHDVVAHTVPAVSGGAALL